jgi:tetratricopeptide (TPR) repeat protein
MTADESLPTYDFEIPLEIKNLEKKAQISELWETAKNAFATNDVEKIRSSLTQITELDDSLYGVWYNLGIAKDFAGWCFKKAIELKPDHINSWRGKGHYHQLGIRDAYVDDNLDQHIHSDNWNICQSMCEEIEVINKFKKLKFNDFDDKQLTSFQVDMETGQPQSSDGANILNLSLCCLKYSMYDEAIKLLETHWYAHTTLYLYFLGIAYRLSGNFEKALEQFDKILNLETKNVYALLQKGLILYKNEESIDEITKIIVATTLHKYLKDQSEKIARDDNGMKIITNTFVDPNYDFFKICLNDCNTCFPSDPFELSLEMIFYEESEGHPETSRRFNEEIIVQLNLDTKNLYDYTEFEKIEKTWNGNYYDFEI